MAESLEQIPTALAGHYEIERQIGQGGMATVYLARDTKHDRQVAVKILRPELAASIGADRFLREIKTAARLQHPNILALYDSGEADGFLYYVMPFVEGESLRDRLTRERQLAIPDAVHLTCEVAEALQCAHDHGVIHRDIKPENILLQRGHALVADFGIARAVSSAKGEKLTETGMAVGTPHYMSPEQSLGAEHLDGRSDEYSLACVLYELLIGQPPFQGPNAMAILARHAMEAVPSLQIVRHSIPDELEDAVMRALEKTPADRFPTVREFAEALLAVDVGPAARRTTARAIPAVRRSTTRGVPVAPEPAAAPPARGLGRIGRRTWAAAAAALVLVGAVGWGAWRAFHRPGGAAAAAPEAAGPAANRIAVLYFKSQPGNDSLSYLADGLTEALIHELSQVSPLQVISSNGVSPFKNAAVSSDSIVRALKVGTLVQGTVAQSPNRLRVSVAIVNGATGTELGSKTLERPREEVFALQDDLAKEVSTFLRERLGEEVELRNVRAGTQNAKAWEMLQRAEEEVKAADPLVAAGDTAAVTRQLRGADSLFAAAEALDPAWPAPIVRRGWLAYKRSRLAGSFDKAYYDTWTRTGLGHAERALALKPDDPDALELRGTLLYWRWLLNLEPDPAAGARLLTGAERDLRASVAANPTQASAWNSLSHLLINKAETAEAKLAAMRAYEADPYLTNVNLTLWRLFSTSVDLEDAVEARHWCEEGERRFPTDSRFAECQIWLNFLKGQTPDVPKAWQLLARYIELSPPGQREFRRLRGGMLMGIVLARAGLKDSARSVMLRSRADAAADPTRELAQLEAVGRTILGDKDEAIKQLSVYFATNPQQRASEARDQSWWFKDLRGDPRYKALVGAGT